MQGNREFYIGVLNLLKLPARKHLRGKVKYSHAQNEMFDEIMVKVAKGSAKGWMGLDPTNLRKSNADSAESILDDIERIISGKVPPACYEYLFSVAEQYRIKWGLRPETKAVMREEEGLYQGEKALGATGLMREEFNKTSAEEAEKKRLDNFGKSVFGPN